mmetsp:Transcript_14628/g.31206  ORF Transcript_14628/g.31206 Transcript_14628/m.31206 type:complete len:213 (-) Transcript_14628:91-729(-)
MIAEDDIAEEAWTSIHRSKSLTQNRSTDDNDAAPTPPSPAVSTASWMVEKMVSTPQYRMVDSNKLPSSALHVFVVLLPTTSAVAKLLSPFTMKWNSCLHAGINLLDGCCSWDDDNGEDERSFIKNVFHFRTMLLCSSVVTFSKDRVRCSPSSPQNQDFITAIPLPSSSSLVSEKEEDATSNFCKSLTSVPHSSSTADVTGPKCPLVSEVSNK